MRTLNLKDVPPERRELFMRQIVDAIMDRVQETLFRKLDDTLRTGMTIYDGDNLRVTYNIDMRGSTIIDFMNGKTNVVTVSDADVSLLDYEPWWKKNN